MGYKIKIFWVVVVVGLAIGLGFVLASYRVSVSVVEPPSDEPIYPPLVEEGKRKYLSYLFNFSVVYPQELAIREYGDGNTTTIVFEDSEGEKGFQVFIVPYNEPIVSEKRFKMDTPSGVFRDPVTVLIDGVEATAFFSENLVIGETREVWFIKDGFLYEISAHKELDEWLAKIMERWEFI